MPVQPSAKESEGEMEAGKGSRPPEADGELEQRRESERRGEETVDESTEDRDSDLDESEEQEEEESSDVDDEDCERRRGECLDEMLELEKQFQALKEKLFCERQDQVKAKLEEVLAGRAREYREPLAALQSSMQTRTRMAGVRRELRLEVVHHKHECELQGAKQHLENQQSLLFDTMKTELLEKIRRLEEDRRDLDFNSERSDDTGEESWRRKSLSAQAERRKKVTLVSGPFIVYMLRDVDVLEDWTAIKKLKTRVTAKAALSPLQKELEQR